VTWPNRLWQDLQPTSGRLSTSLRIVLATVLTLILLMTWQIPAAAIGLYLVFMVSRDSPAVSLRGGILSMLTLSAAVGAVLGVVGLTDNEPMARVVSVGVVGFVVGMVMRATTLSGLGTIFGFIYLRGTPEKRPMRDTSKPANENRQDKVVITQGRASWQRKTSPGSARIGYSGSTWAEDMAPQGCDQSADPAAGNAWAAQAAFVAFLAEKR